MSNTVPHGWTYTELGEFVAESSAGEWGSEAAGDDNDIPVIRSTNFTNSGIIDYSKLAYRNIDEKKRLKKSLKQGDMVLEKSGGSPSQPVGRVVYFDKEQPFLYSNFTQRLSPVDECDSKFLFYKFYAEYQNGTVLKFQQQTTGIINFQLAEYLGYKSVFPPLPEQQKIAAILSSVDEVIEKTRAQIDKLKELKTGMMQELLTKGIGHTAFKPLPKWRVGKIAEIEHIPKSWELVDMTSVAKLESGHTPSRNVDEYWGGDIQWLSLHDTKNLSNPVIKSTVYTVTQDGIENSSARVLPKNTVALSRTASVGNCVMLGEDMATSQDFANYVCGDELYPKYLLHLFRWMQHVWSNLSEGSTHKTIYMPVFKKLQILLPPFDEQERIAEAADKVEINIVAKQKRLEGFQIVKKALMQDLLTGKVRVNVDNKENAVA